MEYLFSVLDKILFIILLMGTGILAKRLGWLSDQGEKDLSTLQLDFTWPCMTFYSIVTSMRVEDIRENIWLPALSVIIHATGFVLGLIAGRLMGYRGNRRRLFMFHATMNNFFIMALPFAQYIFPDKGAAMLAVANLGSILCLWTFGVFIIAGNPGGVQTVRNVCSPCMVATILAIVFVLAGWNRFIPQLILDVVQVAGQPTLIIGLLVAGTQIHKLGRRALKFDAWNILVGAVRNIAVPGLMLGLALLLRGHVGRDALVIFMLVAITPASINSSSLAMKYDCAPELAAEGVIFTHLLAVFTMLGYMAAIQALL